MKEPETEQQREFLAAYVKLRSVSAAEQAVGYAKGSGAYVLNKYKEYYLDLVLQELMTHAPEAVAKMAGMLGDGAVEPGANVRMEAAKQILDRIGIIKKEELKVETAQGGIFFLPMKTAQE